MRIVSKMGAIGYKVPPGQYADPMISERACNEPRPLKVVVIGAGVSGILAAIRLPQFVPSIDLVIYDKNPDLGGTWFENRYPGCACDIPAHSYQLSFESSVEWSKFYCGAEEIWHYWKRVAEKYNVDRFTKFNNKCLEARWNEDTNQWHVKLQNVETGDTFEDVGDVFYLGIGALNDWKFPDIPGLRDFQGDLLHSANWNTSFDAKGKNVAVIGAGSSGIQIVPQLQPVVKHMDHYIRGRTWIAASFGSELVKERNNGDDGNFAYTEEEIENWKRDPKSYLRYRKDLEFGFQGRFATTHRGTKEHELMWKVFRSEMQRRLAPKPEIGDHLIPEFPPLCKRLTPGPGYLEALVSRNVSVINQGIDRIDQTGIITGDGVHRLVDAIVCATGFDASFQGRFPIYGRGGISLRERYQNRVETYMSLCVDGFPNLFQSLGPNSATGNGNLILIMEHVALYIGQVVQRMAIGNVRAIEPKKEAVQDFSNFCDAFFKRTVYSAECGSWYKASPPGTSAEDRKKGRITALWPGSSIHAITCLEKVRFEDFEMTTVDGNPWGWFGDGWAVAERTGDYEALCGYLNTTNFVHDPLPRSEKVMVNENGLVRLTLDPTEANGCPNGVVGGIMNGGKVDGQHRIQDGITAT